MKTIIKSFVSLFLFILSTIAHGQENTIETIQVCYQGDAKITIEINDDSVYLLWQIAVENTEEWQTKKDWSKDKSLELTNLTESCKVRCLLDSNRNENQATIQEIALISVYDKLLAGTISEDQTICFNTQPQALTIAQFPTGGDGSYSYQWQQLNNNTWQDITDSIGSSYQPSNLSQSTTYRLAFTSGSQCGTTYSHPVTITVYEQIKTGAIGNEQTICYNTAPNELRFTTQPSGEDGQYTYQWQQSYDGTTFNDIPNTDKSTFLAGNLTENSYFRVKITSDKCATEVISNSITITVRSEFKPGTINNEQTICYNTAPQTLTAIDAQGGSVPYNYQWQQSNNGTDFINAIGTGSNMLNFKPVALKETTWFRLQYTSAEQCGTLYSNIIQVTVRPEFKPGTIGDEQAICYNTVPQALNMKTNASGGDGSYSYQWQQLNNNTWQDITDSIGSSYQPSNLSQSTTYRLAFTSGSQCGTTYSHPVTIIVYEPIQAGVIGSNQTICYNTAPNKLYFTTPSTGEDGQYTYQWQQSSDNTTFNDITNATTNTFQAPNLTEDASYCVKVTSKKCGTEAISNTITITVRPEFEQGAIGDNQTICYNTKPQPLTATNAQGGSAPYSYQWQQSSNGTNFVNTIGFGSNTLDFTPNPLKETTWFRLQYTSAEQCGTLYSNIIQVTVRPEFKPGTIGDKQTICHNTIPLALNMKTNATGGDGSYTYQWQQHNGNDWSNITDAIGTSYQPSNLTQSTTYRLQFKDGSECGTIHSQPITITVYKPIHAGIIGSDQTICYNTMPNEFHFTTPPSGEGGQYSYQWQQDDKNNIFSNIENAHKNTWQTENLSDTTSFRVIVTSNFCHTSDTSNTIIINILPELKPGTIGTSQTICFNTKPKSLEILQSPIGGDGDYLYRWQSSLNNSNWINIENATSIIYQPAPLSQSTYYRLLFSDGHNCGPLFSDTILVNVRPELKAGTIDGAQTICFNTKPDSLFLVQRPSGGDTSYSYQWQSSNNGINWIAIENETDTIYQPQQLDLTHHYRLQFTSGHDCGTVYSTPITITVYNKLNAGILAESQTICFNTTPNIFHFFTPPSGEEGEYTYRWQQASLNTTFVDIDNDLNTYQTDRLTDSTSYRVIVSSPRCKTIDTTNIINIFVLPEFLTGSIQGIDTICQFSAPNPLSVLIPCSGADGNFLYTWQQSFDTATFTNIDNINSSSYQPEKLFQTTYFRLMFSSLFGCGSLYSNIIEINVIPLPEKRNVIGDFEVCNNQSDLEYFFIETDEETSYQWAVDGGIIAKYEDSTHIIVDWDSIPGIGRITITQTYMPFGCVSTHHYDVNKSPHSAPSKTNIQQKRYGNILICEENSPGIIYQWGYRDLASGKDSLLPESNYPYMMFPHPIDCNIYEYFVLTSRIYENDYSCTTKSLFHLTTDNESPQPYPDFTLYPNPTRHSFFIRINKETLSDVTVSIWSMDGKMIFRQQYSTNQIIHCTPNLFPGMYIVSLRHSKGETSQKLIIIE